MNEGNRPQITPGSYNDATIVTDGGKVLVNQNPKVFLVLAVIALIIGGVIIGLAGKGTLRINNVRIPQPAAKVISILLGGAFIVAAGGCVLQSKRPATLILDPDTGTYESNGGILGPIFKQQTVAGNLSDLEKLVLTKECAQSPDGKTKECWRLTLHGPDGKTWGLGSFDKPDTAEALAEAFVVLLDKPLERA